LIREPQRPVRSQNGKDYLAKTTTKNRMDLIIEIIGIDDFNNLKSITLHRVLLSNLPGSAMHST